MTKDEIFQQRLNSEAEVFHRENYPDFPFNIPKSVNRIERQKKWRPAPLAAFKRELFLFVAGA